MGEDGSLTQLLRKSTLRTFYLNQLAEIPAEYHVNEKEIRRKFQTIYDMLKKDFLND
jgi:hypothetical protein